MGATSLTGDDSVILNGGGPGLGRILANFGDGDAAMLDFAEDIANVKASKNGNVIYALNANGQVSSMKLRLLIGSADDVFLNGLLAAMRADFSGFTLIAGQFTKRVGDGAGNVTLATYICVGGVVERIPNAKMNLSGDTDQSVVTWAIKFGDSKRALM